jgi:hypothetical protein
MRLKKFLPAAFIIIVAAAIFGCSPTRNIKADPPIDAAAVKRLVESQNFVFTASFVNPMSGRRRFLTPGYEMSVSKDTIISYLPFFGRGYTAPVSPSDVDFDFTSTRFTSAVTPSGRGWNISIKPKDRTDIQELYFKIFDNAVASLNITSMDRSTISYDGYISERKPVAKAKR